MFLGLRTVIYPAPDLAKAKIWWSKALGAEPYFDEPYYVGFNIGGYELGLDPEGEPSDGPITYWGVPNADLAIDRLVDAGATVRDEVRDVGGGIRVATVNDPVGSIVGVIENPTFQLPDADEAADGTDR